VAPASSVRGPIEVDGALEGIREGLIVHATLRAHVGAVCSRCLEPVDEDIVIDLREVFEDRIRPDFAKDGDTYPVEHDEIDLEPMVRDAVLPELPGAPLCRPDCLGLCPVCGENRNETPCDCSAEAPDPRWSVLRELEF
jgi:uncharacterized protein